jgi:hypothetical protein
MAMDMSHMASAVGSTSVVVVWEREGDGNVLLGGIDK